MKIIKFNKNNKTTVIKYILGFNNLIKFFMRNEQ
jgi:hypothetical protein